MLQNYPKNIFNILVFMSISTIFIFCENPNTQTSKNPIDTVLGAKFIKTKDTIRANNFKDFIGISSENLERTSQIYNIIKIDNATFLLQPKKIYSEARYFNALLKVGNKKISHYHIFNDYKVIDYQVIENNIVLLFDNFELQEVQNSHWNIKKTQINMERFDNSLNPVWVYKIPAKIFPIKANSLRDNKDNSSITCSIDLIFGSSMCYKTIELKLNSTNGKYISAVKIADVNSPESISPDFINSIFN